MSAKSGNVFSRRALVRGSVGLAASICARLAIGQASRPRTAIAVQTSILRQFKGAQLLAVSPDGTQMCLYAFRHLETFLREWSYDGGNTTASDDVLSVVSLQTGRRIYSTRLRTMVASASFFADGKRLYAETLPMVEAEGGGASIFQQVTIDLDTRRLNEKLGKVGDSSAEYFALSWPAMLGVKTKIRTAVASLVRVMLPDYSQALEVPFAAEPNAKPGGPGILTGRGIVYGRDTMPVFSADRHTMVYGSGNAIVCRRTMDLGLIWDHSVEPLYSGAVSLDITPDGSKVVAAVMGGNMAEENGFYVGVFDGGNGSVIAKLKINGHDGVAISPDGNTVAISRQAGLSDGRVVPTVDLYDIGSGRQVGGISHDAISVSGFGQAGHGGIGGRFTSDGRYLVTSGLADTVVWALQH
jgi:hypothetical protein